MTSHAGRDDRWLIDAFRSTADLPPSDQTCPDAASIWSAVQGQLPAASTRAIVDHLATCGACTDAWRLAHDVAREESAAPARHTTRPVWRIWGGLAAAAVVVLAVGIFTVMGRRTTEPDGSIVREAAEPGVRPLVRDGAPLPRRACRLRWTPGPAGSRYVVRVAAEDLTPIATGRALTAAEYVVPEASLAGVRSGAKLLWQIDVRLPDGSRQTSPTFVVTLID